MSITNQNVLPGNKCWNPKLKKWENCKDVTPRSPGEGGGSGNPPRVTCLPAACCIDFNFFQQLTACIFNLNSAFALPASYFICGGLGGGMTFTQFWRAFTVASPCRYSVLADGTIYDAQTDTNIACYVTGTTLVNTGAIIPPGGLAQCIQLISQSPDCPDIQICWLLTEVSVGGGNCIRRIDNVRYCTQPYGDINTVAVFNACTNCQGSGVVITPTCPMGLGFDIGVGLGAVISSAPLPFEFQVFVNLVVPVCCTLGTVTFNLLTTEFSCNDSFPGIPSGALLLQPTITVNPLTLPGTYNVILKMFYQCPGFPPILVPIPLRITVTP